MGATTPEKLGPWCCETKLQMLYKSDLKCDFTTNSHKITKQSYNITDLVQLHSHACSASVVLLLQPKQKTLQISKLKWRGKITNENFTEWNKNF